MNKIKAFTWKSILALRGNILNNLHELERWQWLDQKHTAGLQQERLKHLLKHAYCHVPYYRKVLLDSGVMDDAGVVNLDNFSNIPLLNKGIIRAHYEELKSDDLSTRKWYENTSGGSTGEPVRLIQDKENHESLAAVKTLDDLWSGYSIGENRIMLWGSERDLFVGKETPKIRLGRWLRNEIWLNTFNVSAEQMFAYVNQINAFKPVQILAYAESIYELSRFIERKGLRVHCPRSIMTSAGTLDQSMRGKIEQVFKTPVFNRYGSREVGDIACECSHHKGLHISPFTHYVEILRQDGTRSQPGEIGEIVITILTNYAMPLIRYRIGDMGAWADEACTCGRSWPILREVTGRVTDNFITRDGTITYGAFFRHLLFYKDWIKKYQIIQEAYDHIRILIVPNEIIDKSQEFYSDEIREITEKIRHVMGPGCRVEFETVTDIAPTNSGKYRYTISRVARME